MENASRSPRQEAQTNAVHEASTSLSYILVALTLTDEAGLLLLVLAMAVDYDGKPTQGCTFRSKVNMCRSRSAELVAQADTRRESKARGQF